MNGLLWLVLLTLAIERAVDPDGYETAVAFMTEAARGITE